MSWLLNIKPLWLREKLYYLLFSKAKIDNHNFTNGVPLVFAPQIRMQLLTSDVGHRAIVLTGLCELKITKKILLLGKKKKTNLLIDVGANYGYYSLLWAGINPNNKAICFEPSPRSLLGLEFNIINNNLNSQIEIHNKAVGEKDGKMFFVLGPEEQTGWGGLLKEFQPGAIEVPVVKLDTLFFNQVDFSCIDVLKIDTEGADLLVLRGAEKLLSNHRIPHIFFEENTERMKQLDLRPGDAQRLLRAYGYTVKHLGSMNYYATLSRQEMYFPEKRSFWRRIRYSLKFPRISL